MNAPLPTRDGVGPSSVWLPQGNWQTLLQFLSERFAEVDPAIWAARLQRGDVVDETGTPLTPDVPYRGGARIYYYREAPDETPIPFEETVLYRDRHLLAVDKPHFLPVTPAGRFLRETLLARLKRKLQLDFLVPIHRIDRETAGVVLLSIEPETRGAYHAMFHRREVEKTYEALAPWRPALAFPATRRSRLVAGEPFFRMREVEGEPNAETRIEVLDVFGETARYRLTPVTGKKHQLRVHMAALGLAIRNDPCYPQLQADKGDDFSRPLQLVAKTIAFIDPLTGEQRRFESLQRLGPM